MKKPNKFVYIVSIIISVYLLASCSSLIPPQVLQNPIGITGKQVQVEIGATGELRAAAAGLGTIQSTFPDVDTTAIPIALNASQTLLKLGFAEKTNLTTSASSLPCNLTLTKVDISITVRDATRSITLPSLRVNKVVELEQQKDDLSSYKIVTQDVFVGNVLSSEEAKKLQDVITTGGNNQVIASVTIQATSVPELPPGSVLTLTFTTSEATVKF